MATTTVLTNPTISIDGTDFTDQCSSVTVTYSRESQDVTTFGDSARKFAGGLFSNEIVATLYLSYGSGEVEHKLEGVLGLTCNVVVRASSAAISATNPEYTLTGGYLESMTPIAGSVGEMSTVEVTFTGGALTRSVTPPGP